MCAHATQPDRLPYLPVFMALDGRAALVAGAGALADAKADLLARAGACVRRVEAPIEADLDGAVLVFDATGDAAVTARLRAWAGARGIPLNVVDRPELSDFIMPAILDRSPVVVAISTGGVSPALARVIRQRLETALPAGLGRLARFAGRLRARVAGRLAGFEAKVRFWERVLDGQVAELAMAGREGAAMAAAGRLLDDPAGVEGSVALVGAGPGDPELLTLAAVRAIQSADVVLYDHLVGPEIVDMARREARRILVGKRAGRHSMPQDRITELAVRFAREGRRVVRLKGGDPGMFGRAAEELDGIRAAGVPVRVIPGVTAPLGAAASLGLSLTLRGVARSVHFVTATDRDGGDGVDWAALAAVGGTIAVYMGRDRLAGIARRLVEAGMAASTPAVAVENATTAEERACFAGLADLPQAAARALGDGPTLVVIGGAVAAAPGWAAARPLPAYAA